jgi:hypothetical protein
MLRDGAIASQYAQMFVLNVVQVAFPRLRFGRRTPELGCARAEFQLKRGVAEVQTLYLDGGDTTVSGEGEIDVGRRTLDLLFTPSTRNPALVGVAATVRVKGPLADPKIRPVARSLVTSAARGVVSNALRPTRVLRNPLRRGEKPEAEPGPCDTALTHLKIKP